MERWALRVYKAEEKEEESIEPTFEDLNVRYVKKRTMFQRFTFYFLSFFFRESTRVADVFEP